MNGNDSIGIKIPADFIVSRASLEPAESVYGYRNEWLKDRDAVAICLSALGQGGQLTSPEEQIALLLSDSFDEVSDLVNELERSLSLTRIDPSAVWLFLALAWLWENRMEQVEPLEVIEMLYADFGYPESIQGLVRFMPAPSGAQVGHRAIEQRWQDFVNRQSTYYRNRPPRRR